MSERLTLLDSESEYTNFERVEPPLPHEVAAQKLAHRLFDEPQQRQYLDIFKQYLIGADTRAERVNGQHPWPEREVDGESWRYTVPVFAGFSDDSTLLAVLKDPWHSHKDGNDWLVGHIDLPTGAYTEYLVTAVSADATNNVHLQIADPNWYGNMPPLSRPGPTQPLRDWHRLSLRLDENYLTDTAAIRWGTHSETQSFYDIEHLHAALIADAKEITPIEQHPSTKHDFLARLALQRTATEGEWVA